MKKEVNFSEKSGNDAGGVENEEHHVNEYLGAGINVVDEEEEENENDEMANVEYTLSLIHI